jgi:16S rRNA processing protein RimM
MRGEVYILPLTDHPEGVFAPGVVLRAAPEGGAVPDPELPSFPVESARPFRGGWLVRFAGVLDRDDAERLRARDLVLPFEALPALGEGEFFVHDLVGMEVRTVEGVEVGSVEEVYEAEPALLLEVRRPGAGTLLIPLSERIVRDVDAASRRIVIDPPEGLLDL